MFLVIGAQKCATSWLYLCLQDHPELRLPLRKREVEYLGGALHRELGDDWYRALVGADDPETAHPGDVSVEYLWDPAAPPEVARLFPDTRVIASLRDPVERAVSAWFWYQRKGILAADATLTGTLESAARWLEDTEAGDGMEGRCDPGTPEELVARGCYDVQLRRWLEHVPPSHLLILDYADIQTAPEEVLETVWSFLGVGAHRPATLDDRPKRNTYNSFLGRLERLAPRNRVWAALLDRAQRWWPGAPASPLEQLPPALVTRLHQGYEPSFRRMTTLLDGLPPDQRPDRPSFTARRGGGR